LDRRVVGPQSRSGHHGEEKNLNPCRDPNPRSSSPVLYHWGILFSLFNNAFSADYYITSNGRMIVNDELRMWMYTAYHRSICLG